MITHFISPQRLTLEQVAHLLETPHQLALSQEAVDRITHCRTYLDRKIADSSERVYGVNTGFGALYNVAIDNAQLAQLQKNLVMSHACGMGPQVPKEVVKLMLWLKAQSLSYGHSGAQLCTVQRLLDFYNNDVYPIVYQQGSLGASGDLAPLAHLSLPLLGLGEVEYQGERLSGAQLNARMGWEPISLQSKEGLALLNGTQFMCAYALTCLIKARRLYKQANMICALSIDAYDGRIEPFSPYVHAIRPHAGQIQTAREIKAYLEGSELIARPKKHVQDPYSFRCAPQVHGASKDAIEYCAGVFTTEMNAATDNPSVFPTEDAIVSAGNFHGQPLALALDFLSIAVSELGSISERRTNQLVLGKRELPAFLVAKPGLNSGFMIPQYTAASIASQNKQLCMPACVDSIDSSQAQEDHVSMGANAAVKCLRVMENVQRILAIELFNAAQALEFRRPLHSGPQLEELVAAFRQEVPFIVDDTLLYPYLHKAEAFLDTYRSFV